MHHSLPPYLSPLLALLAGLMLLSSGAVADDAETPRPAAADEFTGRTPPAPVSLGSGLGVPYGMIGVAAGFMHRGGVFEGSLGVGGFVATGLTRNIGMHLYPAGDGQGFRLSAYYGTNALVSSWFAFEAYDGLSIGLGWRRRFGASRWGLDADLVYIANSAADRRYPDLEASEQRAGKFTVAIGARRFFAAR